MKTNGSKLLSLVCELSTKYPFDRLRTHWSDTREPRWTAAPVPCLRSAYRAPDGSFSNSPTTGSCASPRELV